MSKLERRMARAKEEAKVKVKLPEVVEAGDYWQWQASGNAVQRLQQELRATNSELLQVQQENKRLQQALVEKYGLGLGDDIDPSTLKIIRAAPGAPSPSSSPSIGEIADDIEEKLAEVEKAKAAPVPAPAAPANGASAAPVPAPAPDAVAS
jgi:hypothetical protein